MLETLGFIRTAICSDFDFEIYDNFLGIIVFQGSGMFRLVEPRRYAKTPRIATMMGQTPNPIESFR